MVGDPKGFLKIKRKTVQYRPVCERLADYKEVFKMRTYSQSQDQSSRCMDCGVPFCHWGCPLGNFIPEWNEYMFRGNWNKASILLSDTNNLPEITGRVCPALCESSCVLGVNDDAVTIRENELSIVEHAFENNLIKPRSQVKRTLKRVAVVGSGPAGLSCADELNRYGHSVVVFEKDDRIGGILRYGIPDFKLDKSVIDRRLDLFKKEGIEFIPNVNVGTDYRPDKLLKDFSAVCLAGGSRVPRDLKIEGRDSKGIYFAMDYLKDSNMRVSSGKVNTSWIDARGKKVVVIGGGDTGSDCVGTANRQGADCVVQIEIMPKPSECRTSQHPWPMYPLILKTSSSHEEGVERKWSILTKKFISENGVLKKILCSKVEFEKTSQNACPAMKEIPGSEFEIEADMVILALGFLHGEHQGLVKDLNLELDNRGNVKTDNSFMTSRKGVFCAGDIRRGQSLVVWAILEGRMSAKCIDKYLTGI